MDGCRLAGATRGAQCYGLSRSARHDGGSTLLGTFAGRADLSCHSAAQAAALNESIARSGVVHGSLRARGPSTVVCGFVEPTRAWCWQYAPDKGAYAKVGEWIT